MDDLCKVLAANLTALRKDAGLKQADLAAAINYSDKSISKWERGEALPDLAAASRMAAIFGVSVDYLLQPHDQAQHVDSHTVQRTFNERMVIMVVLLSIWTLAAVVFVIFWILGKCYWLIFLAAVPVSLVTLLVLNTIWNGMHNNQWIVAGLVLAMVLIAYYLLRAYKPWQLLIILVPAEALVFMSYRIPRRIKDR